MKANADKQLDYLARKVIGKSTLEHTSFDFTQKVMSQIKSLNTSKVTTYVPLISKSVWIIIALAFTSVVGYVIVNNDSEAHSWIDDLGISRFSDFEFSELLAQVKISHTLVYALFLLAVMLCVQIPILKRYFDKRLQI